MCEIVKNLNNDYTETPAILHIWEKVLKLPNNNSKSDSDKENNTNSNIANALHNEMMQVPYGF